MTPGLVSIIIPVFERPEPLVEAVGSALAQSYRPLEILVVDDGSTDATPDIAAQLAREYPEFVRVVLRDNGGPGLARESGRQAARGEYLQYLDSDDLLLPRKLELQVAALLERPECGIAYGICLETEADGGERAPALRPSNRAIETMFPTFLAERWWNTVTPLYRAELCERAGPWSALRLEEDWEMDARIAALAARLVFVPMPVAVVRDRGGARLSGGGVLDVQRLCDRAAAHLSILSSGLAASVPPEALERRCFARKLFLLARQCGAAGLAAESRALFAASREASTPERARGLDFRIYRALAAAAGWRLAGRLGLLTDHFRRSGHERTDG